MSLAVSFEGSGTARGNTAHDEIFVMVSGAEIQSPSLSGSPTLAGGIIGQSFHDVVRLLPDPPRLSRHDCRQVCLVIAMRQRLEGSGCPLRNTPGVWSANEEDSICSLQLPIRTDPSSGFSFTDPSGLSV